MRVPLPLNLPVGLRPQVFDGEFVIPAASLSTFNTISIIALVPVYDKLFIPALRACGLQMTMLQRIGWGQVIAILAMLSAAWVETVRLRLAADGKFVEEGKQAVDMAVWYQTPQYILVGLSEVFASIGQLEFFYNQAPGAASLPHSSPLPLSPFLPLSVHVFPSPSSLLPPLCASVCLCVCLSLSHPIPPSHFFLPSIPPSPSLSIHTSVHPCLPAGSRRLRSSFPACHLVNVTRV